VAQAHAHKREKRGWGGGERERERERGWAFVLLVKYAIDVFDHSHDLCTLGGMARPATRSSPCCNKVPRTRTRRCISTQTCGQTLCPAQRGERCFLACPTLRRAASSQKDSHRFGRLVGDQYRAAETGWERGRSGVAALESNGSRHLVARSASTARAASRQCLWHLKQLGCCQSLSQSFQSLPGN
jgi:hypothetical protein